MKPGVQIHTQYPFFTTKPDGIFTIKESRGCIMIVCLLCEKQPERIDELLKINNPFLVKENDQISRTHLMNFILIAN
jgi:hypothetical protein